MRLSTDIVKVLTLIASLGCVPGFAEADWDNIDNPPATKTETLAPEAESAKPLPLPEKAASSSDTLEILNLGVRFDTAFSAGSPTQQGFFIPSARLSIYGVLSDNVGYRFSLGQTREFSTVLLPHLLPVEAFVNISSQRTGNSGSTDLPFLSWRVGMFTPTSHPLWSPDLSDLDIPDYAHVHRAMLLSRDLGTEVSYEFSPTGLKVGLGAFNGNGILSLNSNNTKAFSAYLQDTFSLGDVRLSVGASGYTSFQSSRGSINFRTRWTILFNASVELPRAGLLLSADYISGTLEDSVRYIQSKAYVFMAGVAVDNWMRMWARWESITNPPDVSSDPIEHFQAGPEFILTENLKLFAFYEYLNFQNSGKENGFELRLRLNL